jgi:hypothetical protein
VDGTGDIWDVCSNAADTGCRGRDLLAIAVANGGKKFDSYNGNHGFYMRNSFEPVSWCAWDQRWAPDDWDEKEAPNDFKRGVDTPEDIIFYKYVGAGNVFKEFRDIKEFKLRVPVSNNYDLAQKIRDKELEE